MLTILTKQPAMKNIILLSIITLAALSSCRKDETAVEPENLLQDIRLVETQNFNLGLVSDTIIVGKEGTKITFNRSSYKLDEKDTVKLVLKEFYSFKDIIANNISTITDKGDLLETNGVIYFEFTTNDQTVELKENERIPVVFPSNRILKNDIFYGIVDEYNIVKWEEDDTYLIFNLLDIERNMDYLVTGYFIEKEIPIDSLDYYIDLNSQLSERQEYINETLSNQNHSELSVLLNRYGWINIDKFIDIDKRLDFILEVKNEKDDLLVFSSYVLYDELNSMLTDYHIKRVISFENIPLYDETYLLVVSESKNQLFAEKIKLDISKEKYEVTLKQISKEELSKLIGID